MSFDVYRWILILLLYFIDKRKILHSTFRFLGENLPFAQTCTVTINSMTSCALNEKKSSVPQFIMTFAENWLDAQLLLQECL